METEWAEEGSESGNPFSGRSSGMGEGNFITFEEEQKPLIGTEELQTMKIRFNGKTIGQLSTANFFRNFGKGYSFIAKLDNVDYYDDIAEEYIRVSFNLETPYKKIPELVTVDTPLRDITANEDFIKYMDLYRR